MADQKVTDRDLTDDLESSDVIHVVDVSDLTDGVDGTSKKTH